MMKLFKPYGDPEIERGLVSDFVDLKSLADYPSDSREHSILMGLAEADLLMGDVDVAVTKELLNKAPKVRAVICRSIGVDYVDVAAATKQGVLVLNSPDFCVTAVAEYAMTLMFCAAHRIPDALKVMNEGTWGERENLNGLELYGKTLGLVGFGKIGRELARMALGIGMKVIAYDPYFIPYQNVSSMDLKAVLSQADVISIHTPLTEKTRGMIGQNEIEWMKPSAILINVSRGGIVDEKALYHALQNKKLAFAGLDVLSNEPAKVGDTFYHAELTNLLLTPHVAWNSQEGHVRNQDTFYQQIKSLAQGIIPDKGVVNQEVCEIWQDLWKGEQKGN